MIALLVLGLARSVSARQAAPLPPVPDRFVVFEHRGDGQPPRDECLKGFTRRSHPLYERYHLLILEREPAAGAAGSTADLSRCLGASWVNVPFDYSVNALSIPTDEILVRFKAGVPTREIDAFFREYALTLDEPPDAAQTLTAKTHRPMAESLAIVKKLQTSSLIDYVEPNKLLIRFDR